MALLISTSIFDMMDVKILPQSFNLDELNGYILSLWELKDCGTKRRFIPDWTYRYVDDPNKLIDKMQLMFDQKIRTIRDQEIFDINLTQYELLIALCSGKYNILTCKSSTQYIYQFDVAFPHIKSITLSQIKLANSTTHEKLIMCIIKISDNVCEDVRWIIIKFLVTLELLEHYTNCAPIYAHSSMYICRELLQNRAVFNDYIKENYCKFFCL